ncbi:MAG: DUF815 domain-containing protein [Clostridia bacterium]|nr:DUF815 domain-containing protein [Clostridia bacterium]
MVDISYLKKRADALTVFRPLREDEVFSAFYRYLSEPTADSYADFVERLYEQNGGHWSRYLKKICFFSDNVLVRTVSRGVVPSDCLFDAFEKDAESLQLFADLTTEDLAPEEAFSARFFTEPTAIAKDYRERLVHIGKHGYGIFAEFGFFRLDGERIVPVRTPDRVRLSDLVDYERERKAVVDNTLALLGGLPAANVLLTGDAGTGKSSTIKAVANEYFSEGLRLVELKKSELHVLPKVLETLANNPLKFVLFVDDLSFSSDDDDFNALKAVLEGSVSARTKNVVIYATGNRRHVVKEKFSDRDGDEVHKNDAMQELLSLSDRFGLQVSFFKPNKASYLNIVKKIADDARLTYDEQDLFARAERFALSRGGRSARLARQFIDSLIAMEGI